MMLRQLNQVVGGERLLGSPYVFSIGAGDDEPKRKRRRIVKVGGELVITTSDAVVAAALNDGPAETTESIPIKAIKAQAKAFKQTADMSAMLKAQQYEQAIELYKALVAQDEEDVELLLMNL